MLSFLLYVVGINCARVRDPSLCLPPSHLTPSQAEPPSVTPTRDHHLQDLLRTISSAKRKHDRVTVERPRQTWLCNVYAEHGTWKNLTKRRRGTQNSENGHGVRPDVKMGGGDVVRTFHRSDDNLSFPFQVDTFLALRKGSSDRMGGTSIRSIFIVPVAAAKIITRIYRIPNLLNKTHEASIGVCGAERSAS